MSASARAGRMCAAGRSSSERSSGSTSSARSRRRRRSRPAAFRQGDFSSLATPILDPSTGQRVPRQPHSRRAHQPRRGQTAAHLTFRRRTRARRSTATRSTAPRLEPVRRPDRSELQPRAHALRPRQLEGGRHAVADDVPEPRAADRREAEPHAGGLRQLSRSARTSSTRRASATPAGGSELHDRPARHRHDRRPRADAALDQPAGRDRHAVGRRSPATRHLARTRKSR